jgi:hypothetical protein
MVILTPHVIHSNGQIVATQIPKENIGLQQNIQGGPLVHAANKTATSIAAQARHAAGAGVTMRGSGRHRGGGTVINAPYIPEGGTIPGQSVSKVHAGLLGNLNAIKTGAVYDKLNSATPYKVSGGKRRRKTNGKRKHRNIHRKSRRRTHRSRRNHSLLRSKI